VARFVGTVVVSPDAMVGMVPVNAVTSTLLMGYIAGGGSAYLEGL
jgi:hypothetical protein